MLNRYINFIFCHKFLVVIVAIGCIATATAGCLFLQFSADYRAMFSKDNPQLMAYEELQEKYTKDNNVFFIIEPQNQDVFTPSMFTFITDFTNEAWKLPFTARVDSLSNYQHSFSHDDEIFITDLIPNSSSISAPEIQRIANIAKTDPQIVNHLVSPTGHVTGINVTVELPGKDDQHEPVIVAQEAQRLAARFTAQYPDIKIHITGVVMLNNAMIEASMNDSVFLMPLMFAIILLMIGIFLKSICGVAITIIVIAFTLMATMGIFGWLGITLTPSVLSAPMIIMMIAVADCLHLLVCHFFQIRGGLEKTAALAESIRVNLQPLFFTSLTTAIGFLSMNFSDAPPFRDLGNIVATGVVIAFILTLTLLPALAMILPTRQYTQAADVGRLMRTLADFVIKYRHKLLLISSTVTVILLCCIPRNDLNDEFSKILNETTAFRQATDFASHNLNGLYTIDYSLPAKTANGITNPAYLQQVDAFANWYRQEPEVLHVNSFTDIMKRLSKNLHNDANEWYRLPDSSTLAAQYLLLYDMSLPLGLDLTDRVDIDKSASRFTVSLINVSTTTLLNLEQRAQNWLQHNAPDIASEGSGTMVIFSHLSDRNTRQMLFGSILALILISLLLIFILRSVKIGLLSIVPNIIPAGIAFGLWGIFDGEVGIGLSVVTVMTLGIVVDDTVHFLSKYLRARRERNLEPHEAIRYAFSSVGMAMLITSIVLTSGFLILSFSNFSINADMGLMTAITIATALIADFLLLPPLLMQIEAKSITNANSTAGHCRLFPPKNRT